MASTGFYTFNESTGAITPDTADLQTTVQDEFLNAFGSSLTLQPSTPQVLLITAEVLARSDVLQINCTLANSFNPNFAGGVALDAILALTGSQRGPATFTTVICNLTGVPDTVITQGAMVQDINGNIYQTQSTVALVFNGSTGAASVVVMAVASGPITVTAGEINIILTNILGWETVTNPTIQLTTGAVTQADVAARVLRANTLALQGQSLSQAITSGVYAVPGVTSLFYQQNDTGNTVVINGISMVDHSLYLCESGGDPVAVANVLNTKKSGGCNYNHAILSTMSGTTVISTDTINGISVTSTLFVGQSISGNGIPSGSTITVINSGTEITLSEDATASATVPITFYGGIPQDIHIIDPYSGQDVIVSFDNPTLIPIAVKVTANVNNTIQDPLALIQTAILNYAAGLIPGNSGLGIGVTVSCFEIAGAINITAPSIYLINVQTSLESSISYSNNPIPIEKYQQATIALDNISVVFQ